MPKPIAATLRRQFAWLVVVLLAVGAARFLAGQFLTDVHDGQLARNADAVRANQRMLQDLTDIETGVRGYQLTGEPPFLDPFLTGAQDYPVARAAALRAAPDDHARVLVRAQDQAAQMWLAQFALPIAAQPPGPPGVDTGRSARGKELFDRVRGANADVTAAVDERHRAATTAYRNVSTALEVALAALVLLSVLIALRIHRSARRMLLKPFADIQAMFDRRAGGDLDARAAVSGPPEVRRLTTALNSRLDEADRSRQRLVAVHDALAAQKAYLDQVLDVIDVAVLTPLTTIAGSADLLAEDLTDSDDLAAVARIGTGVERMRRRIDDLLAYAAARDAPLRPAPVDVAALVTEIAADRGITVSAGPGVMVPAGMHVVEPLPVLDADPGMLRRLLENLIGNALKYTPPGRPASVTVSADFPPGGGVHLVVADRGIGIPADQQADVFTSFHRAHTDGGSAGTGLGLAICQRVVARHGGTITAADNPGGGTRIRVVLPAACVAAPARS